MSYTVQQPNLGAVLGAGIGKGLSEQLPKEIERYRLSQGLQNFANQYPNSPLLQQYAKLLSIPGVKESPQLLQTFGELAKSQNLMQAVAQGPSGQGFEQQQQNNTQNLPSKTQQQQDFSNQQQDFSNLAEDQNRQNKLEQIGKLPRNLTTREAQQALIRPFVEPSEIEKEKRASELLQSNPVRWNHDIGNARRYVDNEIASERQQYSDLQNAGSQQIGLQDRLKSDIEKYKTRYNADVPADVFTNLENEAIESMIPKKEGGLGLTETEAYNKILPQMEKISRDYGAIQGLKGQDRYSQLNAIQALQKDFKKRGDLRNFADKLRGVLGYSNPLSYNLSDPIEDHPKINKLVKNLPKIDYSSKKNPETETIKIIKPLADLMKDGASPLSIAFELEEKGYKPQLFLNYLNANKDKFNLTDLQVDQLKKGWPVFNLNDIWIKSAKRGL